jgi:hypothetical protein
MSTKMSGTPLFNGQSNSLSSVMLMELFDFQSSQKNSTTLELRCTTVTRNANTVSMYPRSFLKPN